MTEVKISYNPYRLETQITVNGEEPKENSKLQFPDCRLQEWIEDLPEILLEECASRDFKLTFHGTLLDYEDVEAIAKDAYKNGINIETSLEPAKEMADKEAAIDEIFDEIQKGPLEELKQPDVIKAFNLAKSSEFEVSVVATMSAGKSTLINALLRKELMPSEQEACTATIVEIKDNDKDEFTADVYDSAGNLLKTYYDLTLEEMKILNKDPQVSRIHIEGNIPFVPADEQSLVLVDTPGPNNALNPEHQATTYRMLSESSKALVLYILNATQLDVIDDDKFLNYVAESMKVGGKQSRDRFIFVVNKLDDFKMKEDNVQNSIEKVRARLAEKGIENANIYPASALTALYIRTLLSGKDVGEDDIDEVEDAEVKVRKFNRNSPMYFETMAPLTKSMREEIDNQLADARARKDANEEALIHCGIIPIEKAISAYVQKYSKTAKIKNLVDTFYKRLEDAKSLEMTKQAIAADKGRWDEIQAQIESLNKKLKSGEEGKKFKSKIDNINYDNEIEGMANEILAKAQSVITEQLHPTSNNRELTKEEAKKLCDEFTLITNDLQAKVQVDLENLIANEIVKNAEEMLKEYTQKIAELSQELDMSGTVIDPLQLIEGEIDGLSSVLDDPDIMEEGSRREIVGSHEVYDEFIGFRRFLNRHLGTNFHVSHHTENDYASVNYTYIDRTKLAQRFFAPVQERLYENVDIVKKFGRAQTKRIKDNYSKRFDELDQLLCKKLQELNEYTKDEKDLENRLLESKRKLKWVEDIQAKVDAILDI